MFIAANSYSRDPWGRTFINIETAVMVVYLDDFYRSFKCPVSILRYEKGDRWLMDYAPVDDTQLSGERKMGF
jgi:hypothetical protein